MLGHFQPILAHNGLKIIARKNGAKCNPGLCDGLWLNETNLAMGAAQKRYDGQNDDENGYIKVSSLDCSCLFCHRHEESLRMTITWGLLGSVQI
jgi:hypothetical protein